MANWHSSDHSVLLFGNLPRSVIKHLETIANGRIRRGLLDSLVAAVHDASALLLGEDAKTDGLATMLPSIRESFPSLIVIGIADKGTYPDFLAIKEQLDAVCWLPDDNGRLVKELQSALSRRSTLSKAALVLSTQTLAVLAISAGVVIAWQATSWLGAFPDYILPSPGQVLVAFLERPDSFLFHMMTTAIEAFCGFLIGNASGFVTGVLLSRFQWLSNLSLPVLTGLQAIPIMALAPLFAIWLGTGLSSKVLMAAIVCYFPVVSNILAAFSAVDYDLVQLFVFYRARYQSMLWNLLIPASYSAVLAGLRISGGLAVIGAIVAEFTGADRGLGYLLLNATYRLETDKLFVALLLSAMLGYFFASIPSLVRSLGVGRRQSQSSFQ